MSGHLDPEEDLPPGATARLDQNYAAANHELNELLHLNAEHRADGCAAWYCGSEELVERLDALSPEFVHMVLRAAMERLHAKP